MDTTDKTEKKPYTSPELIEYGNLAEITGGGAPGNDDIGGQGSLVL